MRSTVRRRLVLWLVLSAVGGALVSLPDQGPRVFSFSRTHGPSALDVAGMVVLVAAWVPFVVALWRARARVARPWALVTAAAVGAGVLAWSVATDAGAWWAVGVALLAGAQVAAALSVRA